MNAERAKKMNAKQAKKKLATWGIDVEFEWIPALYRYDVRVECGEFLMWTWSPSAGGLARRGATLVDLVLDRIEERINEGVVKC